MMRGLLEPAQEQEMRTRASAELQSVYADTDYPLPDLDELIREVIDVVVADTRDRAEDQASCGKLDSCTTKAIVLNYIADALDSTANATAVS
jgi:hypothetical protein